MEISMNEIVTEYAKGVYTLALRLCRNKPDADDLFQNTFLRIAEKGSLDKTQNIPAYLYTTTLNLYRKKYGRKKREPEMCSYLEESPSGFPDGSLPPEEQYLTAERHQCIRRCIDEMDDKYRVVVLLYYELEWGVGEIAKRTKSPVGTVKTRLKRAREIIKKRLEAEQWIT